MERNTRVRMIKLRIQLVLIYLLAAACLQAQLDTGSIKILARAYNHYSWSEENYCMEEDTVSTDDTTKYLGLSTLTEYQYPEVRTPDPLLNKLINDAILLSFDHTDPSQAVSNYSWTCWENKPFEEFMAYKVILKKPSLLSLCLLKDEYASGGGSGAGHDAVPFTFDLKSKKRLLLKDLMKEGSAQALYNMVIAEIKKSNEVLFSQWGEINNPMLFTFVDLLGGDFGMDHEGIIIYWSLNYGGKHTFEEIRINFKEHPELFQNKKVKTLLRD